VTAGGGIAGALRVPPRWLQLREPADAAARSTELVEHLVEHLTQHVVGRPDGGVLPVHDLGAGTGSMCRWLAPTLDRRLGRPQRWVLHDRDARLLALAAGPPGVAVETRTGDVLSLTRGDLAGAAVVAASALLDMLTSDELARLVAVCRLPRCPVLLTITVVGRVELDPPHPLDARLGAAFDEHQRRPARGGRLLGPDAVTAAADAFTGAGYRVVVRPSPWRLGAGDAELTQAWLRGWVAAACEQRPELGPGAAAYEDERRRQLAAGGLGVVVHHADLLALPALQNGER
jgi:hypothetical protein